MTRSLRFFPLVGLVVVLLIAGCGKPTEPAAPQTPPPPTGAPDVKIDMADHFSKVREIEEAIIRGDVEAARPPARWIAEHQETAGLPAGTEARVTEMKAAARSVASTDDIGNAAIAAASLVGACGSCHAAAKVNPKLPEVAEAASGTDRARHMLEHQHAINLMYRGLVAPSSNDWTTGALALKAAPLGGKALAEVSKEAVAAEARVHELADRAVGAAEKSARVAIYGSIIGACASCHGLHGSVWGPGLPKTQ